MIRSGEPRDVEALAEVWHEAWHAAHATLVPQGLVEQRTLASFRPRLENLVSQGNLFAWGDPATGFVAVAADELYQLMVSHEARGTGAAAQLLRAGHEAICARGHAKAWLHCAVGNDRARRFYEREGWVVKREEVVDLSTDAGTFPVRSWRMEKDG